MKSEKFTDPRDGQTYRTIEVNGLRLMADNLNFDIGSDCWLYNGNRFYTWGAAMKACPPGWRLPTIEEWENIAECKFVDLLNPKIETKAQFDALEGIETRGAFLFMKKELNIALNGSFRWIDRRYCHKQEDCRHDGLNGIHGDYWSASIYGESHSIGVLLDSRASRIVKQAVNNIFGLSVRPVYALSL